MAFMLWPITILVCSLIVLGPLVLLLRLSDPKVRKGEQAYRDIQAKRRQLSLGRPVLTIDEWYRLNFRAGAIPQQVAVEAIACLARPWWIRYGYG